MVEVLNRQRELIGILQNAYAVEEQLKLNAVNYLSFSLPSSDPKNLLCQPFYFVRYNKGELYRILPTTLTMDEIGGLKYDCEHVFALLIDAVLYGQHIIGNIGVYTTDVIEWLLDKQNKQYDPIEGLWAVDPQKEISWVLGECEFSKQYEYAWEQETILSALLSVPRPFTEDYIWTFNTTVFPYELSLKRIDTNILSGMYIRARKNMLQLISTSDPTTLCTRIYPLGEGEGINQLTIRDVNNNTPYLQSPQPYIDKYGIVERVWTDRRYTNPESLMEAALAMLMEMQEPYEEFQATFAILGLDKHDVPEIGEIVEIIDERGNIVNKTYVTEINYNHDEVPSSTINLANKSRDIAGTVADMLDRQRIEMTYAQGATTFSERDAQGNCDPNIPVGLKMLIPNDLRIINFIRLDVEMGQFRKPFRITEAGGGYTTPPTGGTFLQYTGTISFYGYSEYYSHTLSYTGYTGSSSLSDIDVGGTSSTTVWMLTSSYGIRDVMEEVDDHAHGLVMHRHSFSTTVPGSSMNHNHDMSHDHSINHNHSIDHDHVVPDHVHEIPQHTHDLEPGVTYAGNPTSFDLFINNVKVLTHSSRTLNMEISQFLVDEQNKIPRDEYFKVDILPDDPAYVLLTVSMQGFIQSRGNATM